MAQCPVLTPEQRQSVALIQRAEKVMMSKVHQAIDDVAGQVARELEAIPLHEPAPHRDYFMAVAHRELFLRLCGADAETGKGGDPVLAAAILNSDHNYVAQHWGAAHDETNQMAEPCAEPHTQKPGGH